MQKYGFPLHTIDEVKYFVGNGIPKLIERALPSDVDKETFDKDRERYVFNVPELCEENSRIPGYIRATLAFRDGVEVYDEITEINKRFIVSMSSEEITLRDHPVVGTRIHMASNGIEQHQTLVVYEPMEMIAEKIARAVIQKQ